ncbi:hypothetical protein HanRHA438_Chr03g0114901 [Helianthus annuus]|nr:hypothetical protein HanRHA438_Chr03g0114901 [Helianthus annuus]
MSSVPVTAPKVPIRKISKLGTGTENTRYNTVWYLKVKINKYMYGARPVSNRK